MSLPFLPRPFLSAALFLFHALGSTFSAPAAQPAGTPLIPAQVTALTYVGPGDPAVIAKVVPVSGQSFSQTLQIDTLGVGKSGNAEFGLRARLDAPVKKGDVLWINFKARTLEAKRESGEAFCEVRFEQLVNGKYQWPPYLERGAFVGREWTEVSLPYEIGRDVTPETMRMALNFDHYPQSFEISPVTFLNCGPLVKTADLPRTVVRYNGDALDAPWRAAAAERIEKYRKADLVIKVVDKVGHTDAPGTLTTRAFRGDYEVTVSRGGKTRTVNLKLQPGANVKTLTLP